MKKILFYVLGIVLFIIGVWMIGTGFRKETSAFVDDYSVNNDGSMMTIHTGVGDSTGFIRKANINRNEEGTINIVFISAFGGINGSIGAKDT